MRGKWCNKSLDSILSFWSGTGFPIKYQGNQYGELPVVKVSDMNLNGNAIFLQNANNWISSDTAAILSAKIVPPGAIAFAKIGAAMLLNRRRITVKNTCFDNNMMAAIPDTSVSGKFLYYIFTTLDFADFSQTTALPSLNLRSLKEHQISIPVEKECQQHIADILTSCDEVIEQTEKAIAKYQAIKTGMLQDLFTRGVDANGKLRPTPEEAPELYKDSPLGKIPKEWNVKTIGDIFTFKNGLNKGKEFFGFGSPIVNYMDVYHHTKITPSMLEGRVSLSNQEIQNFAVSSGDVFFTRTSETPDEVGLAAVIIGDFKNTVFSGFVLRARPISSELLDCFKQYCFRVDYLRKIIVMDCTYTTRALTNGTKLSKYNIIVPKHIEQRLIAQKLSAIDEKIAVEKQTLKKYISIKQGLMKRLLTPPEGALEA